MNVEEFDELAKKQLVYSLPDMEQVVTRKDIVYKTVDNLILRLDVYYPRDMVEGTKRPAVLFVHGDVNIERAEHGKDGGGYISWAQLVALSGMIAVTFSHRPSESLTKLTEAGSDVDDFMRYILENGEKLGIDTNSLGIWTASTGPVYAFRAALNAVHTPIRFIVAYYGLMSILNRAYFNYGEDEIGLVEAFSALHYLRTQPETMPPLFIARATVDNAYLNDGLDTFVKEAIERNVPLTFMSHTMGMHGFDIFNNDERSQEIIKATLEFMKIHLLPKV